jgi:hypothetical protein
MKGAQRFRFFSFNPSHRGGGAAYANIDRTVPVILELFQSGGAAPNHDSRGHAVRRFRVSIPFSSGRRRRPANHCGSGDPFDDWFQSPSHRGGGAASVENKSLLYYHFGCRNLRRIRA